MAAPLTPLSADSLNRAALQTPTTTKSSALTQHEIALNDDRSTLVSGPASSPFQTEIVATRNTSPSSGIRTPSRQIRSLEKTFSIHEDPEANRNGSTSAPETQQDSSDQSTQSTTKVAQGDETLSRIREQTFIEHLRSKPRSRPQSRVRSRPQSRHQDTVTIPPNVDIDHDEHDMQTMMSDDTCFSAFSAIPNTDMTLFAKLGHQTMDNALRSPTRQMVFQTPNTSMKSRAYNSSRSPSPTPRGRQNQSSRDGDTTNLLLDFTQTGLRNSMRSSRGSPEKRGNSPIKSTTEPNLLSYINNQRMPSPSKSTMATPSSRKNLISLLDFDLPPQPTPRSLPSITIRELESLKSQYLSEISSLKASLSGREAEVESLKKAVNDAERRVGQAQEEVREERSAREHAEAEKESWEKKGLEVEALLRSVRDECIESEKEKEDLLRQLEESNHLREEAEAKMIEMNARPSVVQVDTSTINEALLPALPEDEINKRVNDQLDEKMENLARELHAVYKKKHEAKVATLKKTYEARADKRCNELNRQIEELSKQNEELQSAKDNTFSSILPGSASNSDNHEQLRKLEMQSVELEEQKARLAGLMEELSSMKESNSQLLHELENERIEKGELVAAVDEMLALQSDAGNTSVVEDFRKSVSRPPSGLKGPGFSAPKVSGIPGKSRMMSNIQRMQ